MAVQVLDFIHQLSFDQAPENVQGAVRLALLDLLGVAASGTGTRLSRIIREHAVNCFGSSGQTSRILFDGRRCSAPGAALAGGMLIDSIDAHDGHKLTKGHIGCGVLPAALAYCDQDPETSEQELLAQLLLGYEFGCRAGISLHATACDYHTSGAWIALACAAIGARAMRLDADMTREALGIAEYHGPRSQMMRTIDHPTMLKDGSGWGAMAGVSAALLAQQGFTGAPALTIEAADVADIWCDLGDRWYVLEQYVKAYPVCRWSQPSIAAVLALKATHAFNSNDVRHIEIGTFHEACRLACTEPETTEQAQYSLPFPVAAALVHNQVGIAQIDGEGLHDQEVRRVSKLINMVEVDTYNEAFPARRISHARIELQDGSVLESDPTEAAGDPEHPFDRTFIENKFMDLAAPVLGEFGALALKDEVHRIGTKPTLGTLNALIYRTN
ncbi:MAG: MmgE/PrpD family protein [Granulosicoccus sp.]|nr:MmgE/PrpD family protein [Granulosicoccus sp.]